MVSDILPLSRIISPLNRSNDLLIIIRSATECWVKIPEPANRTDPCMSTLMDISRKLVEGPFRTVNSVEMKIKKREVEISQIIKNAKKKGKIEDLKEASHILSLATYDFKKGIELIKDAENLVNSSVDIAVMKEEINYEKYEVSKTNDDLLEEYTSFRVVMLHIIASKLFSREHNRIKVVIEESFNKVEELENLIESQKN
ncbi:hypothetical protein ACQ4LE_001637 [Meloidogyne hapla]